MNQPITELQKIQFVKRLEFAFYELVAITCLYDFSNDEKKKIIDDLFLQMENSGVFSKIDFLDALEMIHFTDKLKDGILKKIGYKDSAEDV